jgi:hypothetical protein
MLLVSFISMMPRLQQWRLTAEAGVYNVVDDDPSPQKVWLPAFANFVGALTAPHVSETEAKAMSGDDAVYYATKLNGASNAKAKRVLEWRPRRLEWLPRLPVPRSRNDITPGPPRSHTAARQA